MSQNPYRAPRFQTACFVLLTSALGFAACADDGSMDTENYPGLGDGGLTVDASNVVTGTTDGGVAAPAADTGVPTTTTDTGVPTTTPDSGVTATEAGAPEAGTTDTEAGAPEGGTEEQRPDQGEGDGKDVITIGDSWMNLDDSVGIEESLEKVSGRDYRNYGVPGTKLLDEVIPNQYEAAKKEGEIKTVVMTAGGNDVLQDPELGPLNLFGTPGCSDEAFTDACKQRIDDVAARLKSLWDEMATDGVQDVLIVAYTHTALGGDYVMTTDYSASKIQPICDMVPEPLRCSTLDTDTVVPNIMLRDTIHPVDSDYDKIGQAVWDLMQKRGMRR